MVTFLPVTLVFVLTLFVPDLLTVIAFVDAFSIPWCQFVLPIFFSILPIGLRKKLLVDPDMECGEQDDYNDLPSIGRGKVLFFAVVCVWGTVWSMLEVYSFINGLLNISFSGSYFCEQVSSL